MTYDPAILAEVIRIRLDGAQAHDVEAYAAEKGWGLGPRDLRRYVRRAEAVLTRRGETSPAAALALHRARREALYARAVTSGNYAAALGVLKDLAQLDGVYPDRAGLLAQIAEREAVIRELMDHAGPRAIEAGAGADPDAGGPEAGPEAEAGGLRTEEGP